MLRDVGTFVSSLLALGILVLGGWCASTMAARDLKGEQGRAIFEDINSMRQVVGLFAYGREFPIKEGVLDPYYFVRNGMIVDRNIEILGSRRLGKVPTKEEALRGDYTNFPWERYRGERRDNLPPVFPLFWGRLTDDGLTLVGLNDGSARLFELREPEERRQLEEWGIAR